MRHVLCTQGVVTQSDSCGEPTVNRVVVNSSTYVKCVSGWLGTGESQETIFAPSLDQSFANVLPVIVTHSDSVCSQKNHGFWKKNQVYPGHNRLCTLHIISFIHMYTVNVPHNMFPSSFQ